MWLLIKEIVLPSFFKICAFTLHNFSVFLDTLLYFYKAASLSHVYSNSDSSDKPFYTVKYGVAHNILLSLSIA